MRLTSTESLNSRNERKWTPRRSIDRTVQMAKKKKARILASTLPSYRSCNMRLCRPSMTDTVVNVEHPGGSQEDLEAPEVQESTRSKRNVRIIKECTVRRRWTIGFCWLYSGVISWGWRPEFSFQNTTIVHSRGSNAVLMKLKWATGQTLTPIGLEGCFQRNTETVDSPRVPWSNIQHWQCFFYQKWRRKTAICAEKALAIADGFPWKINCLPEPNDSHVLNLQSHFSVDCLQRGLS